MAFRLIDIENWERKEFYEHFISQIQVFCLFYLFEFDHLFLLKSISAFLA